MWNWDIYGKGIYEELGYMWSWDRSGIGIYLDWNTYEIGIDLELGNLDICGVKRCRNRQEKE